MGNRQALGLTLLRIGLGVFFFFEGLGKVGWFGSSAPLSTLLNEWLQTAGPFGRTYLQTVCLPGVEVFARVVPVAELATGLALVLGGYTRVAALLALLMVLNFHVASGVIFKYSYLTNGYGLPVLGGLLALAVGGAALPMSIKK